MAASKRIEEQKGAVGIDEHMLIEAVLAGDEQAFRPLVESCSSLVYTAILKILRDPNTAEDIAQEAFLQAFLSLNKFRRESSFSTWLVRIAVNKALDHLRREKRRPPSLELIDAMPDGNAPNPETMLLEEELIWQLREEVQQLPAIYRKAINEYYFNRLSYREIAAKEGISEKTVESRLYRAKNMLRENRAGGEGDVSAP